MPALSGRQFGQVQQYVAIGLASLGVYLGAFEGKLIGAAFFISALIVVLKSPQQEIATDQSQRHKRRLSKPGITESQACAESTDDNFLEKDRLVVPQKVRRHRLHHDHSDQSLPSTPSPRPARARRDYTSLHSTPVLPVTIKIVPEIADGTNADVSSAPTMRANSREAEPFETKMFKGLFLLKVSTDPLDPVYAPYFQNRQRTFEFMLQGRFKIAMQEGDQIWFGCEVPEPLSLGLMGRGIVRLLLAVSNRLIAGVHSSLGDASVGELPHIVFPVETTLDRLVITPDGQTPPPLGVEMFPEGLDKAQRATYKLRGDPQNVYSMSMHGMYVDFVKWTLCNMPGKGSISLRSILGDLPLRLTAYILPGIYKGPHSRKMKKYVFDFQMENSGGKVVFNSTEGDSDSLGSSASESDGTAMSEDSDEGENTDVSIECEPIKFKAIGCHGYLEGFRSSRGTWFFIEITDDDGDAHTVLKKTTVSQVESLKGKLGDKNVNSNAGRPSSSHATGSRLRARPRRNTHGSRLRHNESLNTELVTLLPAMLETPGGHQSLQSFLLQTDSHCTPLVMERKGLGSSSGYINGGVHEGLLAVAMWEERWVEMWTVLETTCLSMYVHQSRKPKYRIGVAAILHVEDLATPPPFPAFFLELHTLGRVYYLATSTASERQTWKEKILAQISAAFASNTEFSAASDPLETFMVRQKDRWASERIMLNERRLFFSTGLPVQNPNEQIEHVLRLALALDVESPRDELVEFLDSCATLRQIPLSLVAGLGQAPKLAFVLNLYHCLLAHSLLVLGNPQESREMTALYTDFSYEVGGQAFNLREIKSNLLRVSMDNSARKATSRGGPPRQGDANRPLASLGVQRVDKRIMLAVHSGLAACGGTVPVYAATSTILNAQLDAICRDFLDRNIIVNVQKRTVVLPRVCEEHQQDLGDTKLAVVLNLRDLCSQAKRAELGHVLDTLRDRDIRFSKDTVYVGHIAEATLALPLAGSE